MVFKQCASCLKHMPACCACAELTSAIGNDVCAPTTDYPLLQPMLFIMVHAFYARADNMVVCSPQSLILAPCRLMLLMQPPQQLSPACTLNRLNFTIHKMCIDAPFA